MGRVVRKQTFQAILVQNFHSCNQKDGGKHWPSRLFACTDDAHQRIQLPRVIRRPLSQVHLDNLWRSTRLWLRLSYNNDFFHSSLDRLRRPSTTPYSLFYNSFFSSHSLTSSRIVTTRLSNLRFSQSICQRARDSSASLLSLVFLDQQHEPIDPRGAVSEPQAT